MINIDIEVHCSYLLFSVKTVLIPYSHSFLIAGHGPSDGKCVPRSGVSGSAVCVSPCNSHGRYKHTPMVKVLSLRYSSRNIVMCTASSGSHRRNSDFSRQNKHGFSRSRNRQNEERDNFENFEDSEMFSSKNGPLVTNPGSSKFQVAAAPGPKEKEIVELFKKVQAQLRERAAVKEERKAEESQRKGKESETVDSLLKLLRKHSVQQGKRSIEADSSRDFTSDQPDRGGLISEERNTGIFDSSSSVKHRENESPVSGRPRSNFQRRSPVSRVKIQPAYADYDAEQPVDNVSLPEFDGRRKNVTLEPELEEVESDNEASFSDGDVFDDVTDDEISDVYEDDNTNMSHQSAGETTNLSEMKITELKALAKSRGIKGYSKLKKHELVQLLSGE